MKKTFTPKNIISERGCYEIDQVENLSFISQKEISILDILNSEIPLKDKSWFLVNKTELTIEQKKQLSLLLAKSVVEIYNKKYPNDNRVADCINAIELFHVGKISIEELKTIRAAAYAASAVAFASAASAYDAAAYASAYDAAAVAFASASGYKQKVLRVLINFVNAN